MNGKNNINKYLCVTYTEISTENQNYCSKLHILYFIIIKYFPFNCSTQSIKIINTYYMTGTYTSSHYSLRKIM